MFTGKFTNYVKEVVLMTDFVDYGLYFLNEKEGYTQKELIEISELVRKHIGEKVKDAYGLENIRYEIKTERMETDAPETRYKSLKITTSVPNTVDNNGHSLESILKRMDEICPDVEKQGFVDEDEKSHYIVFNGIGFLGGSFYRNDKETMEYVLREGVKLGFKKPMQYVTPNTLKKKRVLSYQSASPSI